MKRWLASVVAVLAIGCAASGPATLDEATRPIGQTLLPSSPSPTPGIGPSAQCLFDAECPKGHRCEAPRPSAVEVGTCIASAEGSPHS